MLHHEVNQSQANIIEFPYSMDGSTFDVVDDHPYLRVQLNSRLSWDTHIKTTQAKATKALGFLRRNLWG